MRNGPTCRPRLFTQDRPARCYFQSLGRNLQTTTRDFDVRNSGKGTLAPKRLQHDGLEIFRQMHKIICQFS